MNVIHAGISQFHFHGIYARLGGLPCREMAAPCSGSPIHEYGDIAHATLRQVGLRVEKAELQMSISPYRQDSVRGMELNLNGASAFTRREFRIRFHRNLKTVNKAWAVE